jgi:acetolactate synthase-1/2/3 large subunit
LIRLDIDAQQIMRNCAPDIALLGDAKTTLQLLLQALSSTDTATQPAPTQVGAQRAQLTRTQAFNELPPVLQADIALLHALRDYAPHALWVGDSTRLVYAGNMGYSASAPHTWFNASVGFGALGYGLPAAIGAAIGTAIGSTHACQSENPQRTVVCLVGDGGFQFTMAEMGTAIEVGARLVVILLNNYGYGEIKAAMQSAGVNPTGVDLHTPDFVRCAQAYGWQAMRIGADIPATQWATLIGYCIANVNTDADEKTKQPMLIELCV